MDSTTTDYDILEKKLNDPAVPPICLPLQFLKAITCDFSSEELGKGGYGVVYKGVLRSGKIIAVKKLFGINLMTDEEFLKEVSYLMDLRHQNIVQLVGYCAESMYEVIKLPSGVHQMAEVPTRLLCFEYLCNKSLDKHVSDESSGLDWYQRFEIIKGICSGLHYLHGKYIVHLDIKPENTLMDATMTPKVADFGLSRLLGAEKSRTMIKGNPAGSRGYMAPEYIFQGLISPKADIFSFGVIIIEMITGCRKYPLICTVPYLQNCSRQSIEMSLQQYIDNVLGRWTNIFKKESMYASPEKCTQQVKECITIALKCVDCDSARRPNAWEILQMLDAVGSPNCHTKDIKDSLVYQEEPGEGKKDAAEVMGKVDTTLDGRPTGTPLPDKKVLHFILARLQEKDTYGVFSEPVNPEELPDYSEVVEHPMDFSKIREKLFNDLYSNLEQFEDDVFLLTSNAMSYNADYTIYYQQAQSIEALAKKDFEKFRQLTDNDEQPKPIKKRRPRKKRQSEV